MPVQITTTHQNRFWSPNRSHSDAEVLGGATTVGSVMLASGTPSSFAASRRASALRPRDSSQRTDSGEIQMINRDDTIGSAPVAATPGHPSTGRRFEAIAAAKSVPSATGTTIMLETKVR